MPNPFSDLISQLDLNRITQAITSQEEGDRELPDFDLEDAKSLVWSAGEKWLLRDLSEFTLDTIEEEKTDSDFTYVMDFGGTVNGLKAPFIPYAGQKVIVDWKTSKNTLGTDWRERLLHSWQYRLYAYAYNAKLFIYRGLSRNGDLKEIIIDVAKTNDEECRGFLKMIGNQMSVISSQDVWPMHRPFACKAYGRDCEFMEHCENYSMPKGPAKKFTTGTRHKESANPNVTHYSFLQIFQLCPEKARRYALGEGEGQSEESAFGNAVHKGLAELWRQGYETCKGDADL